MNFDANLGSLSAQIKQLEEIEVFDRLPPDQIDLLVSLPVYIYNDKFTEGSIVTTPNRV